MKNSRILVVVFLVASMNLAFASETKGVKIECTQEHADMGHCTMKVVEEIVCTAEHAAMGHCEMVEETIPECTAEHAAMGHCEMLESGDTPEPDA